MQRQPLSARDHTLPQDVWQGRVREPQGQLRCPGVLLQCLTAEKATNALLKVTHFSKAQFLL